MSPEERLTSLGLQLPSMPRPVANYLPYKIVGDLLFLSGQGPRQLGGTYRTGRVGREIGIKLAYQDARTTALQLLAATREALGNLERVAGVVKSFGMVNAEPDFADHPSVINGCSDLLVEVFGEKGRHARSAIGVGSLPNGMTVEIEAVLQISAPDT
jgi:enamine deaminase RidA (YjgF/YER057c/UK114 family)